MFPLWLVYLMFCLMYFLPLKINKDIDLCFFLKTLFFYLSYLSHLFRIDAVSMVEVRVNFFPDVYPLELESHVLRKPFFYHFATAWGEESLDSLAPCWTFFGSSQAACGIPSYSLKVEVLAFLPAFAGMGECGDRICYYVVFSIYCLTVLCFGGFPRACLG